MSKTRLVLFAHGSGDPRWRAPFEKLDRELAAELGRERVTLAYMEFVGPTLLDAASGAVRDGIEELRVLPLFLSAGAHVAQDIPEQAAKTRSKFPKLQVQVLPPIGEDQRFVDLIKKASRESLL